MSTKKKQGLILTLAIILILAGIFQQELSQWGNNILSNIFPTAEPDTTASPKKSPDPGKTTVPTGTPAPGNTDDNESPGEPSESALPAGAKPVPTGTNEKEDYFSAERIARDSSRARLKEEYEKITRDSNASNSIKTKAYDSIMELVRISEAEKKIEMLIREKGYEDCFACFSDTGDIDVIVKADSLSEEKVAQIADIVSRHGNVTLDKIHLRSVK